MTKAASPSAITACGTSGLCFRRRTGSITRPICNWQLLSVLQMPDIVSYDRPTGRKRSEYLMAIKRASVYVANTVMGGATNPSIMGFAWDDTVITLSDEERVARIVAFVRGMVTFSCMAATNILRVSIRAAGSGGGVDMPYPAAQVALLDPLLNADAKVGIHANYPGFASSATLAIRGASINIAERTATPGRKGQGRLFVPFTPGDAVDGSGFLRVDRVQQVTRIYEGMFLGKPGSPNLVAPTVPLVPAGLVIASAGGTSAIIQSGTAQPTISILRSRRR